LFDKTDAVKPEDSQLKYFYTAQNMAITMTPDGQKRLLGQDMRNNNGRCIKTRDMFNHSDSCERPGSVIWLQKDPSLPPITKIEGNRLAVSMGASLSTMRAKGVENVDAKELGRLVIEPFANPFRVHPLLWDCQQFMILFKMGTACYVMNTHAFGTPDNLIDIPKELSLKIVTELARNNIQWKQWKSFEGLSLPSNGTELFGADFVTKYEPSEDKKYLSYLRERMQDRITYLSKKRDIDQDMDSLFIDPLVMARTTIDEILSPI
ncbi:MAG: hypothetical protein HQK87_12070, partial [Nitrospinae bacterium]|nr:hypothetical protein [Nitrospinota bacterium]